MRLAAATGGALSLALCAPGAALADGDAIDPSELPAAWTFSWPVAALAVLALALFAQGVLRLRRRGRRVQAGAGRVAVFCLGTAVLVAALLSPLDAVGETYLLSGHMLQHVLIGDAAPALLVASVRGPLVVFLLPSAMLRPLARAAPVREAFSFLLRPSVGVATWLGVFALWHVPAAYDAVLARPLLHDLEHASFVAAGLLVWSQLVDPARRRRLGRSGRLGLALGLFAAGQVLADVLIFSFHPLYPAYADQAHRLFGISPLLDQRLAGLVMTIEQAATLGTCAALLLWPALHRRSRVDRTLAPGRA